MLDHILLGSRDGVELDDAVDLVPEKLHPDGEVAHIGKVDVHRVAVDPELVADKIDVVPQGWGSVQEVFEHVYKHECHVSSLIDELVNVASEVKDKASQDFLWGYVREQVEEEATAQNIVEKLRKCGDAAGILYLDDKLGQRK